MSRRAASIAVAIAIVVAVVGVTWLATGMAGFGHGAAMPPRFVDEAGSSGIDHRYDGGFEYFVGGVLSWLDCDADGRPDLYLAGGERAAALYLNRSPVGGALAFEDARTRSPASKRLPEPTRSMSTPTASPISPSCGSGRQRPPARARRLPVRAGE